MNSKTAVQKAHKTLHRLRQDQIGMAVFSGAEKGKVDQRFLQRALSSLAIEDQATLLQKEVESMLHVAGAPSLATLLKSEIPLEISKEVAERMFQVFMIGLLIKETFMSEVLQRKLVRPQSDSLSFYKEEYEPCMGEVLPFLGKALYFHSQKEGKKVFGHLLRYHIEHHAPGMKHVLDEEAIANSGGDIFLRKDVAAKLIETIKSGYRSKIKSTFQAMISSLQGNFDNAAGDSLQHYDGKINKNNYVWVAELVDSDYFRPDDWLQNIADIEQVLSPQQEECFPAPIRIRVREMHESFVFGNWMGVAALGRSLLEYMLVDRSDSLKIEVYDKTRKDWVKGIRTLVRLAATSELAKPLEKDMKRIVKYGNRVMHPANKQANGAPVIVREDALACMQITIKIIQSLYRGD